jgi:hypothetical protein
LVDLATLFSICSYQQFLGPLALVADRAHAWHLLKRGILTAYDRVDTQTLKELPSPDRRWWSLPKILSAGTFSDAGVVVDQDLWFTRRPALDPTLDFQGLHWEDYAEGSEGPYAGPEKFTGLPELASWDTLAVNTAFMYIRNERLRRRWLAAVDASVRAHQAPLYPCHQEAIFMEQRLLPALAQDAGLRVGTLLPTTFNTHRTEYAEGAWTPEPGREQELSYALSGMRHLWGLKGQLDNPDVAAKVARQLEADIPAVFTPEQQVRYADLLSELSQY